MLFMIFILVYETIPAQEPLSGHLKIGKILDNILLTRNPCQLRKQTIKENLSRVKITKKPPYGSTPIYFYKVPPFLFLSSMYSPPFLSSIGANPAVNSSTIMRATSRLTKSTLFSVPYAFAVVG